MSQSCSEVIKPTYITQVLVGIFFFSVIVKLDPFKNSCFELCKILSATE